VDAERFAHITRRDRLGDVLDGLAAAAAAGLSPVKVNAVLDPVTGLDDAVPLLRFCLDHGYQLRIIEQMPLDAGHRWRRDQTIEADRILNALRSHFDLVPDTAERGSAPAQLWRVDGGPHVVGVIASVSDAFCGACDRTRLTADGQVRSCLFSREETDLRRLMRRGVDDDAVEAAWRAAMWAKPAGHGITNPEFVQPTVDECDRRLTVSTFHDRRHRAVLRRSTGGGGKETETVEIRTGSTVTDLLATLRTRGENLAVVLEPLLVPVRRNRGARRTEGARNKPDRRCVTALRGRIASDMRHITKRSQVSHALFTQNSLGKRHTLLLF